MRMRRKPVSVALLLVTTALLLNAGVASAMPFSITLAVKFDGNGAGKTVIHQARPGDWTFGVDFTPDFSAERLFIDLYVQGKEFSIHLCLQDQVSVCYPGTITIIENRADGLSDRRDAGRITLNVPLGGSVRISVFLDDRRGDGQLTSATISITHP